MDITRQLYDAENSLRDFVDMSMRRQFGSDWMDGEEFAPLTAQWSDRQEEAERSQNAIKGKEGLIHYAQLSEIRRLLKDYWNDDLEGTFGEPEILDAYLRIMEDYRHPDSRRRELLVHQKHLLMGISGDIRSRIVLSRGRQENTDDIFPRIESVKDGKGNIWTPGMPRRMKSSSSLVVGEEIEFIITAFDPLGEDLQYRVHGEKWQPNNVLVRHVEAGMIGRSVLFHLTMKSRRRYHAHRLGYDDKVTFEYQVRPE